MKGGLFGRDGRAYLIVLDDQSVYLQNRSVMYDASTDEVWTPPTDLVTEPGPRAQRVCDLQPALHRPLYTETMELYRAWHAAKLEGAEPPTGTLQSRCLGVTWEVGVALPGPCHTVVILNTLHNARASAVNLAPVRGTDHKRFTVTYTAKDEAHARVVEAFLAHRWRIYTPGI